jgi:hypothetical protein
VNLDALVSAGQRPWRPSADARDVDVWDRFDFPTSGTYRLGDNLIIFTLITTAGARSLWAYVPVPPELEDSVGQARFDSDAEFSAFVARCFAGRYAIFAAAQDFLITAKSDGTLIGTSRYSLLAAATQWYITRVSALLNSPPEPAEAAEMADGEELLHAAQGALASALA